MGLRDVRTKRRPRNFLKLFGVKSDECKRLWKKLLPFGK